MAKHYCALCETHIRTEPLEHAEELHGMKIFYGEVDGNWKDHERKKNHRIRSVDDCLPDSYR